MSQALDQFQKTLVYRAQSTEKDILEDLEQIHGLDKASEKRTFRFGCGGGLLLVATVPAVIFSLSVNAGLGVLAGVVLGGGAVALLVMAFMAHRADVEDRRYELARAILNLIGKDMAPDSPVNLEISMRPADRKENFQGSGQAGLWQVKFFHDPWLQASGRLLDGTNWQIHFLERRQNRHRWKRSASGKQKLKKKKKSALEAVVRLKAKTRRYDQLSEIGKQAQGAVQLPGWAQLKRLAVEDGVLVMKAVTKAEWDAPRAGEQAKGPHGAHLVAMMLLSMYQVLNLSRAVTKAQEKGS